jgi:hypothetical protein
LKRRKTLMKRFIPLAAVVILLSALSPVALAQQAPGSGPAPAAQDGTGKTVTPEQFQEKKARILKMIEERRTRLDQEKACVEAATNMDDLRKCRPEPPMGMRRGGMRQDGPGPKRPMSPPAEGK